MAASSSTALPVENRLDDLPNEILEMIMIEALSNGVTGLHALVRAYSQARFFFERRPYMFLLGAIQSSDMDLQLQKIYSTIVSIRQRHKYTILDENFSPFLIAKLKSKSTTVDLDLNITSSSNPIDILRDAAEIYTLVESAEHSFVRVQLPKISSKIESNIIEHQSNDMVGIKERPPSTTELHRIRRALWRLRLYFEAYSEPYVFSAASERLHMELPEFHAELKREPRTLNALWGLSKEAKSDYIQSQKHFFSELTVWELEEMECVWFHLNYQVTTLWRHQCPFCRETPLPDRYVVHLRECQNPRITPDFVYGFTRLSPNFLEAVSWFRPDAEINPGTMEHDLSNWSEGRAREPNAGFTFRCDHYHEVVFYCIPPSIQRGPLKEYLEWGYCIWDRQRLAACRLVDRLDRTTLAKLDLWKMDRRWRW